MINILVNQMVDAQLDFWNGVARMAGYEDYEDVDAQSLGLCCDWVKHTIDVERPVFDNV